ATLVFEADGLIRKHAGGYSDWAARDRALAVLDEPAAKRAEPEPRSAARTTAPRKLSYKLQRELDALPGAIEALERQVEALRAQAGDPELYQRPHDEVRATPERLQALERELEAAVDR